MEYFLKNAYHLMTNHTDCLSFCNIFLNGNAYMYTELFWESALTIDSRLLILVLPTWSEKQKTFLPLLWQ